MTVCALHLSTELALRFDVPVGMRQRQELGCVPTGIPGIDKLIGGGIPKGNLTEICGGPSSGRTTVISSLLAQATRREECCAWIDASGAFDPASAEEAGVELARVLWVNCGGNAEHALKATDLLIQAGGFGLVVLDLGDMPVREVRRIPLASWFRLRHAAEKTGAALVAVEREVCARSCSAIQLEMRRKGALWSGKRLRGLDAQAESRKHFRARVVDFQAVR